jgi:hypothetical protein
MSPTKKAKKPLFTLAQKRALAGKPSALVEMFRISSGLFSSLPLKTRSVNTELDSDGCASFDIAIPGGTNVGDFYFSAQCLPFRCDGIKDEFVIEIILEQIDEKEGKLVMMATGSTFALYAGTMDRVCEAWVLLRNSMKVACASKGMDFDLVWAD